MMQLFCSPARTARVGATSFNAEMQLQSLLLPSESMRDRNETEQVRHRISALLPVFTFSFAVKCKGSLRSRAASPNRREREREKDEKGLWAATSKPEQSQRGTRGLQQKSLRIRTCARRRGELWIRRGGAAAVCSKWFCSTTLKYGPCLFECGQHMESPRSSKAAAAGFSRQERNHSPRQVNAYISYQKDLSLDTWPRCFMIVY